MTEPAVLGGPVLIVGLGALGGSLARALRAADPGVEIRGRAASEEDVQAAVEAGVVTGPQPALADDVAGARWLVLATPLSAQEAILREAAEAFADDGLVLDVGSLQLPALEAAERVGLADRFIACHPMAGTEASGFAASRDDLFRDARVWLSAEDSVTDQARRRAVAFWERLGAHTSWTGPFEHDARMAVVSHLPQLASNALARILADAGFGPDDLGPGGLDMLRLSGSDPTMWKDLLTHSGDQVAALLRLLARELEGWSGVLGGQDLDELERRMAETRRWWSS